MAEFVELVRPFLREPFELLFSFVRKLFWASRGGLRMVLGSIGGHRDTPLNRR